MAVCATCQNDFTPKGSGRPPRFCSDNCRKTAAKHRAKAVPETPVSLPVGGGDATLPAVRRELRDADRVDTSAGRAAMALARRIDAGADTGSALAALVRQLELSMEKATAGAHAKADPLDELRARRERNSA